MTKDEATWRCSHGWLRGEQCEICKETMTKDEALKLALEALEDALNKPMWDRPKMTKAIIAIKEALAQPEQEPVAWRVKVETKLRDGSVAVGYQLRNEKMSAHDEPLYTTPPKRPWVGLTELEKAELWGRDAVIPFSYADAIEAKLKSKNA